MFSSHVIMAIEVLLFLELVDSDAPISRSSRGRDISLLQITGEMRKPILRSVLRKLVAEKYISWTSRAKEYVLLKNPTQITVLSLIQLFHGDICIGQVYDHYQVIGYDNLQSKSYQKLMIFEKNMYDKLHKQLTSMPITKFQRQNGKNDEIVF